MIVTLITKRNIQSFSLPAKATGQYWLYQQEDGGRRELISIEGNSEGWLLKSNRSVFVVDQEQRRLGSVMLAPLSVYNLNDENGEFYYLFTEPVTEERQVFKKYLIVGNVNITIGRDGQNALVLDNRFVSSRHAVLQYSDGNWSIEDLGAGNGTFVNGKRVRSATLAVGDCIYIMGFKIVIGKCFIALNNPDYRVSIHTVSLQEFVPQRIEQGGEDYELPPQEYFYRSPRFKRDVEVAQFRLDSPPQRNDREELPLMLMLGPSVTMGMASMSTAIFAISNAMSTGGNIKTAAPSVVMSMSMVLGTVMWPVISKKYERKRSRKREKKRQEKYREYLDKMAVRIDRECRNQEEILRENAVSLEECVSRILNIQSNLWERGAGQKDFLQLRVGVGSQPLLAEISYGERKFTVEEDNLQEELYMLCETEKMLNHVPMTLSVYEDYISGVVGERRRVLEFAKGLIFQIAALYSYDEVKMVFLCEEEGFDFVKWLPHAWSNDRDIRFVATSPAEVKTVSAYIEKELEIRDGIKDEELKYLTPYYIIFSMSKNLARRAEMLKQIYAKKENKNISVISFYDALKNLPKECTMVVDLGEKSGTLFDKNDIGGKRVSFSPDIFLQKSPEDLGVRLANISLDVLEEGKKLPGMITFLQMFGVGKIEHLNALTRWQENDPTQSLETEIGVDAMGEKFMLDLHEKFHGPHGLVAGMTGSGKSEFIMTYILSLAVNYHPLEVAFILIDYKGGGMAKSFEKLPHTAGIITNLDGAGIKRSLISIESELKRRQEIFARTSKEMNVSNIDIYKYQKLRREGKVSEPLQHLFIISDEFAELKTQQPEFMEQLVSAARIGRSLGVHLILATQKPSGVVDDQIWSNSKFRICLKVQERADSMDMLKRPDAAELKETGRFYLQVGYNELFEIGQSAWAGATYYPSDSVLLEKDDSVAIVNRTGQVIWEQKPDRRGSLAEGQGKQMDGITKYLGSIAREEGIRVRPLWLEPIPAVIYMADLKKKYRKEQGEIRELNPMLGEYDNPRHQRQCPLRLPISREGNAIVYGAAGSGKTTLINALVYSLITDYTPAEVNLYIMDFASETLTAFRDAPHVGEVLLPHEEEKVGNLFRFLHREMARRKKVFADFGGDFASYAQVAREQGEAREAFPAIVVVISNYTAFGENYEAQEDLLPFFTREGTKYGIYFVITALGVNGVRFRIQQNFKQFLVLQLNDETDYSSVVGRTGGMVPSPYKGRGLVKRGEIYEFQIAHLTEDPIPYAFLQNVSRRIRGQWNGVTAARIPILPKVVDEEFLSEHLDGERKFLLPVGVEKNSLEVYRMAFDERYIHMVLSEGAAYQNFLCALGDMMCGRAGLDVTVLDAGEAAHPNCAQVHYHGGASACEAEVAILFEELVYRNNTYKDAQEQGAELPTYPWKVFIVQSLAGLQSVLSKEGKEKMGLILERGCVEYQLLFILGDEEKNVSSYAYESWYKQHVSKGDGIWVGDGFADQYQMKPERMTSRMREELPPAFGVALRKGKAAQVKLLGMGDEEEEDG